MVYPEDYQNAEFILAHGTEAVSEPQSDGSLRAVEKSVDELKALLERCAALPSPPPMIVANPVRKNWAFPHS